MTDPKDFWMFYWYWNVGIGKVMGAANWPETERYYTTITEAIFKHDKTKMLFDVSSEVWIVLLFENCEFKWRAGANWMIEHNGKDVPKRTKENKHEDYHKTFYTTQDGGQKKGKSGWLDIGLERYNVLYGMIFESKFGMTPDIAAKMKARGEAIQVRDEWMKVERDFLSQLQVLLKLSSNPNDGSAKSKKAKSKPAEKTVTPIAFDF